MCLAPVDASLSLESWTESLRGTLTGPRRKVPRNSAGVRRAIDLIFIKASSRNVDPKQ